MLFRHMFAIVTIFSTLTPLAHAEYKCKPTSSSDKFMSALTGELEKLHATYKSKEALHQARLEAGAKTMIESGAWSESEKSSFFLSLIENPEFLRQEQHKTYYNNLYQTELRFAHAFGMISPATACGHATNTVIFLGEIIESSEAQFKLMEEGLEKAAEEKNVKLPAAA